MTKSIDQQAKDKLEDAVALSKLVVYARLGESPENTKLIMAGKEAIELLDKVRGDFFRFIGKLPLENNERQGRLKGTETTEEPKGTKDKPARKRGK